MGYAPDIADTHKLLVGNAANFKLRIEILPRTLSALVPNVVNLPIDENSVAVAGAVTDDINETITPLTCDVEGGIPFLRIETP